MATKSKMQIGDPVYDHYSPKKFGIVIDIMPINKPFCQYQKKYKVLWNNGNEEEVYEPLNCLKALKTDAERKAKTHKDNIEAIRDLAKAKGY